MSDLHKNFKEPAKRMASTWIKAELKAAFPWVKFSCRESRGTGSAVYINWVDGPSESEVKDVVNKYQSGHFDGMTDCYEYGNHRDDLPQVRYVFTNREVSAQLYQEYADLYEAYYGEKIIVSTRSYPSGNSYTELSFANGRVLNMQGDDANRVLHQFIREVEDGLLSSGLALPAREPDPIPAGDQVTLEEAEAMPAPIAPRAPLRLQPDHDRRRREVPHPHRNRHARLRQEPDPRSPKVQLKETRMSKKSNDEIARCLGEFRRDWNDEEHGRKILDLYVRIKGAERNIVAVVELRYRKGERVPKIFDRKKMEEDARGRFANVLVYGKIEYDSGFYYQYGWTDCSFDNNNEADPIPVNPKWAESLTEPLNAAAEKRRKLSLEAYTKPWDLVGADGKVIKSVKTQSPAHIFKRSVEEYGDEVKLVRTIGTRTTTYQIG